MRLALATIAATMLAAQPALADSVPNKARRLADRGRTAHDSRDYSGAIVAFTEAYALAPAPALLFNLAQAYRLRGDCDDAAVMYRRFLATGPSDDARLLAEAHLSTVERCLAAKVTVAAKPLLARPLAVARHPEPAPEGDWRIGEQAGLGLAIGGGAALLFAGFQGIRSHRIENEVERRYADGESWRTLGDRAAQGDRAATVAKVSLAVGAAAIVAGATILVIDHRRHRKAVRIEPAPGGARIGMSWSF